VLATLPSTTLTEIAFTVAFGILLDTIFVRSVLVTALNLDLGHLMWWPAKLARQPEPAPRELASERAASLAAR
jgi:putative drug exporter of the RND superfamily